MEENKVTEELESKEVTPEANEAQEEKKSKVYTEEEVAELMKKKQSDVDKGVQKLIAEAKFKDSVIDAVKAVSADNSALIDIHEKNPRVAKEILAKYYDGQSIEDYKAGIGFKEDLSDPEVFKRKVERETQKRLEAKQIEQAKDAFMDKLQLSAEDKEEFEKALEERRELKTFNATNIQSHLEKAYREIDKTDYKALQKKEVVGKSMATGEGKSDGGSGKSKTPLQSEIAEFLKKYGN
jgi:hypothetical protein